MKRPKISIGVFGLGVASWLILAFLTLPLVALIGSSFTTTAYLTFPPVGFTFKWYQLAFADSSYILAFWVSTKLAVISTAIALVIGVSVAFVIARSAMPGKNLLGALFLSPLVLPAIVLGIAILQYVTSLGLARTFTALLIGHCVLVVPYTIRTTLVSFSGLDPSIEEASQDLGANTVKTFFLVTLPQIKAGVIAGALFAFITSWMNVEVTIFNATTVQTTLPLKILYYIQATLDPTISAVSAATIYIAIIFIIAIEVVIGVEKSSVRS